MRLFDSPVRTRNSIALLVSALLVGLVAIACGGGGGGGSSVTTPAASPTSGPSGGSPSEPEVLKEITLPGTGPFGAKVTPDGTKLFVPLFGTYTPFDPGSSVAVIDTSTDTVIGQVAVGTRPEEIDFTPDGAYAFVTNSSSGSVSVIRVADLTVVRTTSVGAEEATYPYGVVVQSGRAYVLTNGADFDGSDENISVLDADPSSPSFGARVSTITASGVFARGGFRRAGTELVAPRGAAWNDPTATPEIAIFDPAAGQLVDTIPILQAPGGWHGVEDLAITPNGDFAYAPFFNFDSGTDEVFVIYLAGRDLWDIVRVDTGDIATHGIAIRSDGLLVGVTSWNVGMVSWIYTPTNTVVYQNVVGLNPNEVAFTPNGLKAYVTNQNSHTVTAIRLPSSTGLSARLVEGAISAGRASAAAGADLTGRVAVLREAAATGDVGVISTSVGEFSAAVRWWADRGEVEIGRAKDPNPPGAGINRFEVPRGGIDAGMDGVTW